MDKGNFYIQANKIDAQFIDIVDYSVMVTNIPKNLSD